VFQAARPARFLFSRSMRASLLIHAAGILLLLAASPSPQPTCSSLAAKSITLIAPTVLRSPRRARQPRLFSKRFVPPPLAPRRTPAPALAVELPPPAISTLPALADPPPALPPTLPPPPLRTDNLPDAHPPGAQPSMPAATHAAGFASAEAVSVEPTHGALGALGQFSAASSVAHPPTQGIVTAAGFGDTTVEHRIATNSLSGPSTSTPVEIISKPRPAYTDEARRLRIEGEVLLEVEFEVAGRIRVLRVLRGLGHGLDENATAAAREIKFRPARRSGKPFDSIAILHVVFQLAY
jgi:TonB family protein